MTLFGNQLRELRVKHNLTQRDLANKLKSSESAIGMYERNEREPSFEITKKLADIFDVTTDYLLGISTEHVNQQDLHEVDLQKALHALKERKAHWGQNKLSNAEQETLEKILEAVIKREAAED